MATFRRERRIKRSACMVRKIVMGDTEDRDETDIKKKRKQLKEENVSF